MTKTLWIAVVTSSALMLFGCDVGSSGAAITGKTGGGDVTLPSDPTPTDPNSPIPTDPTGPISNDPTGPTPTDPTTPTTPTTPAPRCDMGKKYEGFATTDLIGDRVDLDMGVDRARVKPFSSLAGEYTRVLGAQPALIAGLGTTFGEAQARWNMEPLASAVSLYTAYRVAFQGCLTFTGTANAYAAAPTDATARTECVNFSQKFWSRPADTAELDACVKATVADTSTGEPNLRRRWAYGCASVLTSAGFLSY